MPFIALLCLFPNFLTIFQIYLFLEDFTCFQNHIFPLNTLYGTPFLFPQYHIIPQKNLFLENAIFLISKIPFLLWTSFIIIIIFHKYHFLKDLPYFQNTYFICRYSFLVEFVSGIHHIHLPANLFCT